MAYKVLDLITDALFENGTYGRDTPVVEAADSALALRVLNDRLDSWAALKRYAYNVSFSAFTLAPNHQPHLIGPGLVAPNFAAAQRPVRIEGASLILNNVPQNVDVPLTIRDDDWWRDQSVKSIATSTPTDLYYSPDWPNGSIYLWPVPTFAYGIRLELWGLVSQFVAISDVFTLPPGYRLALKLTLAEDCCGPFGRVLTEDLKRRARDARVAIQSNNIKSPRIASADYGTDGSHGGRRGGFNYYTGK